MGSVSKRLSFRCSCQRVLVFLLVAGDNFATCSGVRGTYFGLSRGKYWSYSSLGSGLIMARSLALGMFGSKNDVASIEIIIYIILISMVARLCPCFTNGSDA